MAIQNELREQGSVWFEGVELRYAGEWRDLQSGDTYVAERNQGPKLLTVHHVDYHDVGAVFPVENAYPYDLGECVKVEMVLD
jgi:hypothetical protein